jgi:hypothetical protein
MGFREDLKKQNQWQCLSLEVGFFVKEAMAGALSQFKAST